MEGHLLVESGMGLVGGQLGEEAEVKQVGHCQHPLLSKEVGLGGRAC